MVSSSLLVPAPQRCCHTRGRRSLAGETALKVCTQGLADTWRLLEGAGLRTCHSCSNPHPAPGALHVHSQGPISQTRSFSATTGLGPLGNPGLHWSSLLSRVLLQALPFISRCDLGQVTSLLSPNGKTPAPPAGESRGCPKVNDPSSEGPL